MNISVLGLGQYGYALLRHIDRTSGDQIDSLKAWDVRPDIVKEIAASNCHPQVGDTGCLSSQVKVLDSLEEVCQDADIIIMAISSAGMNDVLQQMKPSLKEGVTIITTAKALDEQGEFFSHVVARELQPFRGYVGALVGAGKASDILAKKFSTICLACENTRTLGTLKALLETPTFRVETTMDVETVELAGATKNLLSLLYGIMEGQGSSESERAYIMARIRSELEELRPNLRESYMIPAWHVDVTMSCRTQTRNKTFGTYLGQGLSAEDAFAEMHNATVEGWNTLHVMDKNSVLSRMKTLAVLKDCLETSKWRSCLEKLLR